MKKLAPFVVFLASIALFGQAPVTNTPAANGVRPVAVLFSATDAGGNPVRDITKEKVSILDNNNSATVADVHSVGDAPLSVAIVLLASKTNFSKEKAAASDLVQKLLRSDKDRAFVITAGGDKPWPKGSLQWQSDRDALVKSISSLDQRTGVPDAFNYNLSTYSGDTPVSANRYQIESLQGSDFSVFDAIWGMMMMDNRPARRVVILFRNPWAHAQGLSQRNREYSDHKHGQIVDAAQRLHAAIYTIGVEEPNPVSSAGIDDLKANYGMNGVGDIMRENDRQIRLEQERLYSGGRANVERLADETGGKSWWSGKKNYAEAVSGIANSLSAQYLVTFVPVSSAAGPHALKVKADIPGRTSAPNAFILVPPPATK